jgi:beta-glucosidase
MGQRTDYGCTRYTLDVKLAADLGCTSFRLSLEWARLEPVQGEIDKEAVARFERFLQLLFRSGVPQDASKGGVQV